MIDLFAAMQQGALPAASTRCAGNCRELCGISTFGETTRRPGQYIVNLGCVEGVDTFALETVPFDGKHLL